MLSLEVMRASMPARSCGSWGKRFTKKKGDRRSPFAHRRGACNIANQRDAEVSPRPAVPALRSPANRAVLLLVLRLHVRLVFVGGQRAVGIDVGLVEDLAESRHGRGFRLAEIAVLVCVDIGPALLGRIALRGGGRSIIGGGGRLRLRGGVGRSGRLRGSVGSGGRLRRGVGRGRRGVGLRLREGQRGRQRGNESKSTDQGLTVHQFLSLRIVRGEESGDVPRTNRTLPTRE